MKERHQFDECVLDTSFITETCQERDTLKKKVNILGQMPALFILFLANTTMLLQAKEVLVCVDFMVRSITSGFC